MVFNILTSRILVILTKKIAIFSIVLTLIVQVFPAPGTRKAHLGFDNKLLKSKRFDHVITVNFFVDTNISQFFDKTCSFLKFLQVF